jgi:small subunit ribosomal protein S30e
VLQGRAMKRLKYNRRFVNVVVGFAGKKRGPNSQ